jgi:hypothetical protein
MLYTKPGEHPSVVAALSLIILLSAEINSSTHCTVASVAILTGWLSLESSATFQHLRISRPSCELLYATNTSHGKQETFIYECPLHWVLLPTKTHNRPLLFGDTPQAQSPFWLLKPASEHVHAHLLPRLWWSWTVLLPSDTHRNPITSITAVLLPLWPIYWLSLLCSYDKSMHVHVTKKESFPVNHLSLMLNL